MAINHVNQYPVSVVFSAENKMVFEIPKYQREYTWGSRHWEDLFDDLADNNVGYFLGTIICIDISDDPITAPKREVIDGQQRLTTLSLMLAALYSAISVHKDLLTDDQQLDLLQLKRKLVVKDTKSGIRLIPQAQNNNLGDYKGVLAEQKLIAPHAMPKLAGLRRIKKAFEYFRKRLSGLLAEQTTEGEDVDISPLFNMLEKVNAAIVVMIEVSTHSDAYTLFESLNNRGTPLTAVDLIKNLLLAKLDKAGEGDIDYYFSQWQQILNHISDDYSTQERFFRHYYNAFRRKINATHKPHDGRQQYPLGALATRSNLLDIYEKVIKQDPVAFLETIMENASIYSRIILKNDEGANGELNNSYRTLSRVQGAPSYLLLMYLESERNALGIADADIVKIVDLLVKFFIRRNLTDTPPTRDLTRIFMAIIDDIAVPLDTKLHRSPETAVNHCGSGSDSASVKGNCYIEDGKLTSNGIFEAIRSKLVSLSAPDSVFEEKLCGQIYNDNTDATRFVLCTLAERDMTVETKVDLWQRSGVVYTWTIEHIFPQGDTIPDSWVEMIAAGDKIKAKEYQAQYVHTLGNLTITGFNSLLSNRSFEDKRDRKDNKGRSNGYRNGLNLNSDVVNQEAWTIEIIQARTVRLVKEAMELFSW